MENEIFIRENKNSKMVQWYTSLVYNITQTTNSSKNGSRVHLHYICRKQILKKYQISYRPIEFYQSKCKPTLEAHHESAKFFNEKLISQ